MELENVNKAKYTSILLNILYPTPNISPSSDSVHGHLTIIRL